MPGGTFLFRDPIHDQITFVPGDYGSFANHLNELVNTKPFQRLRHIRQLGLADLVFPGAEHSRFAHSLGVGHMAKRMLDCVARNSGVTVDPLTRDATVAAALLHDIGHGPFSHALEDSLGATATGRFHHEALTLRYLDEPDSPVRHILEKRDPHFPSLVASYIDSRRRDSPLHDDVLPWSRWIVSSQMDADRFDYLLRDGYHTGTSRHPFDIGRLLTMIVTVNDGRGIGVHEKGVDALESYLVALLQAFRTIYFHKTSRGAVFLLGSIFRRVIHLLEQESREDRLFRGSLAQRLFPSADHPFLRLLTQGARIDLASYSRLTEYLVWSCVEQWQYDADLILSDLSRRLIERRLFKSVKLTDIKTAVDLKKKAEARVQALLPHVDEEGVELYVGIDHATRPNYQVYDWSPASPERSIFIASPRHAMEIPLENYPESAFIGAVRAQTVFHRLIVPAEVREDLKGALPRG